MKLIIIGTGETADIAHEYFEHDSPYDVCAFAVEGSYKGGDSYRGLPLCEFEHIRESFPPEDYQCFVAVSYIQLNRVRERLFDAVKIMGYKCASYISSRAFVWRTASIGENCMIFENNVVQHGVRVEDNVILWSGNHIGHQTTLKGLHMSPLM